MVSFAVRHVADTALAGGRVLPSRRKGASPGRVVATRRHFGIATSYQIDERNGSARTTIPVVFPDAKYDALDYTPSRTGYRFLGWYDAPSGGTQVTVADQVRYGVSPVYAHWQDHVTVTFDATTNGGAMPQGWTAPYYFAGQPFGTLPMPTHPTLNFGGWYLGDDRVTSASLVPAGGAALVARYVARSGTVDLNGQWRASSNENPDSALYDEYESFSNQWLEGTYDEDLDEEVPPAPALMKITLVGFTEFTVYIRSWAESDYDFAVAFDPDVDARDVPARSWGYGMDGYPGVKATTKGYQTDGTGGMDEWTEVTYRFDGGGEHVIWFAFSKDSSDSENDDQGFLLVPKEYGLALAQGGGS